MSTTRATIPFRINLEGPDPRAIVEALLAVGWIPSAPTEIDVDYQPAQLPLLEAVDRAKRVVQASYEGGLFAFVEKNRLDSLVKAGAGYAGAMSSDVEISEVLAKLATIPFEIASFGDFYYKEWGLRGQPGAYRNPMFDNGHDPLGWGAAFRGAGHDRLVSRHWLEGGSFKLWRGAGDVSLVQFHALDADGATALEQAKPGHREIGITDDTGFLQRGFVYTHALNGLYVPASRTMKVVVLGRVVPHREMLEWAAAKKERKLGAATPVDDVAFVFPVEDEARAHLPLLWRYGHQVWAIRDGIEIRLDTDYAPPDTTPAWAR